MKNLFGKKKEKSFVYPSVGVVNFEVSVGDNVTNVIKKMIALAIVQNTTVQCTFNGATFQVTKGSTEEEAYEAWNKQLRENSDKYWNSPEGKAQKAKQEAERKQKELDDAEVDRLIANEVLELSAPEAWKQATGSDSWGIAEFAERWGKLMQVEMRSRNLNIVTKEVVSATEFKADNNGMSGASFSVARNALIMYWKYGEHLGYATGFSKDKVLKVRADAEAIK